MCKNCISKNFFQFTLINLFLGWWGLISFFVTPIFLVNNTIQYFKTRSLAPVPPDAAPPQLDERALRWLEPHEQELQTRLAQGENIEQVIHDISNRAGVTPGQVQLYLKKLQLAQLQQMLPLSQPGINAAFQPAHPVRGEKNTWTCSVCHGYVRSDATFCKHCKASFGLIS